MTVIPAGVCEQQESALHESALLHTTDRDVRGPSWSPLLKVHAVDLLAMGAIVVADIFSGLGGTVLGLELVALATQQATTPED